MKNFSISRAYFIITFLTTLNCEAQFNENFINKDIQLQQIEDSLFVHITWVDSERYGRFSSNGLVYINKGKALLVDTPMDSIQTKQLVNFLSDSLKTKVTHFIAGHYHADCVGGLEYLHKIGVKSFAGNLTRQKCMELGLPLPQIGFDDSLTIEFNKQHITCYYLGGGHTRDNILVYFNKEKVLFGGCFVKSNSSRGMGNTKDADMDAWPKSMTLAKHKFTQAKIVIPGHGELGGTEQFDHTLQLLENYKQNQK
ncbi:MAG: subclass B1 metallo-beta-lactamase [Salinivirgaceae bacterium]|jgi:metallo-beta-lactamase class B|nr:subclass B1 metallo-beta-lactamase [Salinivirgaceae bacterium]